MQKLFVSFLLLLCILPVFSQNTTTTQDIDSLYREDQFYIGMNLNFLTNTPVNSTRSGFSSGFRVGMLRDFPLSKSRRFAVALGVGFTYDQFRHNLLIQNSDSAEPTVFDPIPEDVTLTKNRFSLATIELPIEIRFRTSNPTNYDFFRFYPGITVGYAFWHRAVFEGNGNTITSTNISEFDKIRIGATLSVGYDSFNAFIYYGLNTFFDSSAKTTLQENVGFQAIKVGMIFYLL